jgi:hypothetical protein
VVVNVAHHKILKQASGLVCIAVMNGRFSHIVIT